jgi:hypothetical protein
MALESPSGLTIGQRKSSVKSIKSVKSIVKQENSEFLDEIKQTEEDC